MEKAHGKSIIWKSKYAKQAVRICKPVSGGRKPKQAKEDIQQVEQAIQNQLDITPGELIEKTHLDISDSRLEWIVK